jgi:hypothetical protein
MSMTDLLRGFRRPAAEASAADLRETLAAAERKAEDASARVAELELARGDVLLGEDTKAAAAHEKALREARDEAERLAAVIAALRPRIEAADARENEAALQGQAEDAERISAEAAEDMATYVRAAREMLGAAERINEATRRVMAHNSRAHLAGRSDLKVTMPIARAWPDFGNGPLERIAVAGPRRTCLTLDAFDGDLARLAAGKPASQAA